MPVNKRLFALCLAASLLIVGLGFAIGATVDIPRGLLPEGTRPEASVLTNLRTVATFKTIFFNNSRVFLMMLVGILTCGLLSIFEALLIGAMLGLVCKLAAQQGVGIFLLGMTLAPHGIFELTAFLVVAATGIYLGMRLYRNSKGEVIIWSQEIRGYLIMIAGAYAMLVVAAVLETYLTPLMVSKYLVK